MAKVIKDSSLSELILRKYEKPYNLNKRELIKKICLSLGLLQAGDSRDIIVDILLVLIDAGKEKEELEVSQIKEKAIETRQVNSLEVKGIADSNIRRQLKRLRDLMIVEKNAKGYKLSEFETLSSIFKNKIEGFLLPQILARIKEYLSELEKQ
ncbi:MAG: hypothetical protein V1886_04120 [archaeon]